MSSLLRPCLMFKYHDFETFSRLSLSYTLFMKKKIKISKVLRDVYLVNDKHLGSDANFVILSR